jgi:hypothetical protein
MKKWIICLWILALLSGCGGNAPLETVRDSNDFQIPEAGSIVFDLPGDASETVFASDEAGTLYLCNGYTITAQTLPGGDLSRTLQTVTGYTAQQLTVLETVREGMEIYRTVWTAAGEGGAQLGKTAVLDDGYYHYALSVMADAEAAGELEAAWDGLFESFMIRHTAP